MARSLGLDLARWVIIIALLMIMLFPFYWMLNTSLKPIEEIFLSPPTFFSTAWSFDAYWHLIQTRPILLYFMNSLIVAVGTTVLSLFLASLAAYGVTRFHIRFEMLLIVFLLFTKMLPETLLVIPYFQLMSSFGLINSYLALIMAYTSFALPFSVWMLIGFFRAIPRELDEAAIIDGASRLQAFWKIILPLGRPGLVAVAIFTFLIAWNAYIWALVLTTDPSRYVLSIGVANLMGEYQIAWNELMAAAVIAVVPVMILYAFLERYLVAGITAGAVKG